MAPVTLAMAKANTVDPVDLAVIDEFRKFGGELMNRLPFDPVVSAVGGGAALAYTYTRLITEAPSAFRRVNTEFVPGQATRGRFSVDLAPLGGSFQVDRVLSNLGPATTSEVTFQMQQTIKSAIARFCDEFINGVNGGANTFDTATPGFDGIDKAVTGTVTEKIATSDYSFAPGTFNQNAANDALDELDEWLQTMNGTPDVFLVGYKGATKLRSLARRAGYYERARNEFGQEVESYRGIPFVNLGQKAGSSVDIIPTSSAAFKVTSIYAVRFGLDAVHGVSTPGQLITTWLPDFTTSGAVKTGEVEMGPVAIAVKATRSVGVLRIKTSAT